MRGFYIMRRWLSKLSLTTLGLLVAAHGLHAKEEQEPKDYNVLGLGSAFIDYILKVNDEELEEMKYDKGTWAPIEYSSLSSILKDKEEYLIKKSGGGK